MSNFIVLKFDRKTVLAFIVAIALSAALCFGSSALASTDGYSAFSALPGSPPAFLFPAIWGAFYILSGVAGFIVWRITEKLNIRSPEKSLIAGLIVLAICFLWPIVYFNLNMRLLGVIMTVIALVLNLAVTLKYFKLDRTAGILAAVATALLAYLLYCNIHALVIG